MNNGQTGIKKDRQDHQYQAALNGALKDLDGFLDLPVTLDVVLGKKNLTLEELRGLAPGSLLALDRGAGEELSVYLGDRRLARAGFSGGGDTLAIRITGIHDD
jgi:flagellar motor switch/type III secretory pathway protein FliN